MNTAEECLKSLQNQDWDQLNKILSDNSITEGLAKSGTFSIFENVLIDELFLKNIKKS